MHPGLLYTKAATGSTPTSAQTNQPQQGICKSCKRAASSQAHQPYPNPRTPTSPWGGVWMLHQVARGADTPGAAAAVLAGPILMCSKGRQQHTTDAMKCKDDLMPTMPTKYLLVYNRPTKSTKHQTSTCLGRTHYWHTRHVRRGPSLLT
jgi:hypothetical protein